MGMGSIQRPREKLTEAVALMIRATAPHSISPRAVITCGGEIYISEN